MMRFTRKFGVGSLMLILFNVLLMSYANLVAAAPPPAGSPLSATTSSSTSPSGLPLPPSKMPAGQAQEFPEAKTSGVNQLNSQLTSELQNQALSTPNQAEETSAGSFRASDNQNAHHDQGESSPATSHNGESFNGVGETSKVFSGEKAAPFVDFPPFAKKISPVTQYQRQRRSHPMPSLSQPDSPSVGPSFRFTRPDELELRLDDERDREAFLKLMSILTSKMKTISTPLWFPATSNEDDGQDDGTDGDVGDEDAIKLGSFQRPVSSPYWTPSLDRSNDINLMSSLLAAEPARANGPHGLYGLGERDIGISRRALSLSPYRDVGDNDGEWMEQAVPLSGSHFKARRSGPVGNNEFTFNPVKSHFRRYLRAVPLKSGRGLEFMANGGQFGPILASGARFNRRRRATPAMEGNNFPTIHWM